MIIRLLVFVLMALLGVQMFRVLSSFGERRDASKKICVNIENVVHVAMVGANQGKRALEQAVRSVKMQRYRKDRTHIWLFDDGSVDAETIEAFESVCGQGRYELLQMESSEPHSALVFRARESSLLDENEISQTMTCLKTTRRLGPAAAKYYTFRRIAREAGPNDVVVVVDADDELYTKEALYIINDKYVSEGVWFTYGSYVGKYSDQTKPIRSRTWPIRSSRPFEPRKEGDGRSWRYGHPRTFKAHLLAHLAERDFQNKRGEWLQKATDRGFVYRFLELSGIDRVGFISKKIYKYKFHSLKSTLATVPKSVRIANLRDVLTMPPSNPIALPVDVVLITRKRENLLRDQLESLQSQAELLFNEIGRPMRVHLINKNMERMETFENVVKLYCSTFVNRVTRLYDVHDDFSTEMAVHLSHQLKKSHAFELFLHIHSLRTSLPLEDVVFVDADHKSWPIDFILRLVHGHTRNPPRNRFVKTNHGMHFTILSLSEPTKDGGLPLQFRWSAYGTLGGVIYPGELGLLDIKTLHLMDTRLPRRVKDRNDHVQSVCSVHVKDRVGKDVLSSIPTFVINLNRREERFAEMKEKFRHTNLHLQRFEAFDASTEFVNGEVMPFVHGQTRQMTLGEVGIRESMRRLITYAKETNLERILVFEDDVVPHKNFDEELVRLLTDDRCGSAMMTKHSGGTIQLGSTVWGYWDKIDIVERKRASELPAGVVRPQLCFDSFKNVYGAFAVMYHQATFDAILSWLDRDVYEPFDWVYGHLAEEGYVSVAAYPHLAIADTTALSDINSNRSPKQSNMSYRSKIHRWDLNNFDFELGGVH